MQAAKDLVYDRTLRAKESIQGHPLDYKQAMATFSAKAVGNFRYLAVITPWRQRELDRLDRYWRQGFKTAWRINVSNDEERPGQSHEELVMHLQRGADCGSGCPLVE